MKKLLGIVPKRLLIIIILICVCIVAYLLFKNRIILIDIPTEFTGNKAVFIGQRIDEIEKVKNITYESSIFGYYEKINDNSKFDEVYYNTLDASMFLKPDRILDIVFEKQYVEPSRITDSIVYDIFSKCEEYYGSNYIIVEVDINRYNNPNKRRPKIIWNNDSCFVSIVFMPEVVYNVFKSGGEGSPTTAIILTIANEIPDFVKNKEMNQSSKWTITTLFNKYSD